MMNQHVDKETTRRRIVHIEGVLSVRREMLGHECTPPAAKLIIASLIKEDEEMLAFQRGLLDVNAPIGLA